MKAKLINPEKIIYGYRPQASIGKSCLTKLDTGEIHAIRITGKTRKAFKATLLDGPRAGQQITVAKGENTWI